MCGLLFEGLLFAELIAWFLLELRGFCAFGKGALPGVDSMA